MSPKHKTPMQKWKIFRIRGSVFAAVDIIQDHNRGTSHDRKASSYLHPFLLLNDISEAEEEVTSGLEIMNLSST